MDKMIRIIKLVPGTLVLQFQDATTYDNERDFIISSGQPHINLKLDMVVSMFQLPGTMSLYNRGYFTFSEEDKEAVFKRARELSLYYGEDDSGSEATYEQPGKVYREKDFEQMLRLRRLTAIKEVISEGTPPQHRMLIEVARKNFGSLSVQIVKEIENGLGVQLDEGDE